MRLLDFSAPEEAARWTAIDDSVMGGTSASGLRFDPGGHAVFSGHVSLANSGGFASVRRAPGDLAAGAASAYLLEVRGDGKRYKFALRSDDGFDGINYQCGFDPPAGEWVTCRLSCDGFRPTWRGRILADAVPLDPARVRQAGLVIADRQAGPFALAIRAVGIETASARA